MTNSKQPLIILGAGLFAEEVYDLALDTDRFTISCFIEGIDRARCTGSIDGVPIVWAEEMGQFAGTHAAIAAIGSPKRRNIIQQAAALGIHFANIIHPTAHVSRTVTLGSGVLISAGVVVGARTEIGSHVIINRSVILGHHAVLSDYVTVSPGANIAGLTRIGENVSIGMGALVLDHRIVGRDSVVGAGSVVTKDVPELVQVLGVPAKVTKQFDRSAS